MMIDARSPVFWQLYPNGCHVYDARGRLLRMVVACNPETGEVIRYDTTDNGKAIATNADGSPRMRHGFWPAPLRVVSVPYRVGDGAREKRIDITAAEIIARARAKEQRVEIINRITAATGKTVTPKLTVADLDELIDKVEDGAREQRAAIDAIEESIRPMLKRGEWLNAWRGIDR